LTTSFQKRCASWIPRPLPDNHRLLLPPTILPPLLIQLVPAISPSSPLSGTVYINTAEGRTAAQVSTLKQILEKYECLWEDRIGRVLQPEDEWLTIPLKEGAALDSKGKYRVSRRDEAFIDKIFDHAIVDGRMAPAQGVVSVGWPIFVVWQKGKGRVVVDLRSLNDKVQRDSYPLPLQSDIIGVLRGKEEISTFDLQKMFYQFMVAVQERWKLTVVSHRGQEWFNCVPMGFVNSPSHAQKFMDKKLLPHRAYARCYIDNIVVFSDNFEDHLNHIDSVLKTLADCGMTLGPDKCYVGFHSIKLLGHKVDRYGLSTLKEKTDAIASLEFPKVLAQLDYFLGLAGFYRYYVARFASLAAPLQLLKTKLYKGCPRKGPARQTFTRSTKILSPTSVEIASFETVKRALCSELTLIHENPKLPLIYNNDSSIEGFACAVHQVPQHLMDEHNITMEDVMSGNYSHTLKRPVLYLLRLLSKYEVNYWPTELEIAGVV
jgi:hypothetical protein